MELRKFCIEQGEGGLTTFGSDNLPLWCSSLREKLQHSLLKYNNLSTAQTKRH